MTVKKTDEDLKPKADGPEIIGADDNDETVKQLRKNYPKARQIEKLASGNYAVRFRNRKPVYKKRSKR